MNYPAWPACILSNRISRITYSRPQDEQQSTAAAASAAPAHAFRSSVTFFALAVVRQER